MRTPATEHSRAFSDTIKSLRVSRGWGLRAFARAIPIAPSYQCSIECGTTAPPSDTVLARMAEILDIPYRTLLIQAGRLPPDVLQALWSHPAIPAILSTLPGMTLADAEAFCRHMAQASTDEPSA